MSVSLQATVYSQIRKELIWPPLAYKSCIVFILKLSILTMLLTLFALFTLHRARRGHPVTPPCLHNCDLSAPFYTQPWEPDYTVHEASTQSALKLVCAFFCRAELMMNGKLATLCCTTWLAPALDLASFVFIPLQLLQQEEQFQSTEYIGEAFTFETPFKMRIQICQRKKPCGSVSAEILPLRRRQRPLISPSAVSSTVSPAVRWEKLLGGRRSSL